MKTNHLCKYLLLAIALGISSALPQPSRSAPSLSLRNVRRVAVGNWSGDAGFKRRLMRDMSAMGFRWVGRAQAQGIVSARTSWKRGGFTGEMWIRDRKGRVLWHDSAYRAPDSNRMAGATLASKLRAALRR